MVERGAKHLTFLSRRAPTMENSRKLNELRSKNVIVDEITCDVSSSKSLGSALQLITRPIRGVVHAAMVLDVRYSVPCHHQNSDILLGRFV